MMDVNRCQHLCKIDSHHYPREAETFDLRIRESRNSFDGSVLITLFAATEPTGKNTVKYETRRGIIIKDKVIGVFTKSPQYKNIPLKLT